MSVSRYRNFIQLCERWPVDKSRGARDLGGVLRKRVMEAFSKAEASVVDEVACDRSYASLQRIVNDVHRQRYTRQRDSNATGSGVEALKQALSESSIKEMEGKSPSLKERLFSKSPAKK